MDNHHRFRAFKHHRWKSVSTENCTGVLTQVEGGSGKVDGVIRDLMMSILNPRMSKRSGAFPLKVKLGADFNLKTFWDLIGYRVMSDFTAMVMRIWCT